jgi:hypothetical protein
VRSGQNYGVHVIVMFWVARSVEMIKTGALQLRSDRKLVLKDLYRNTTNSHHKL